MSLHKDFETAIGKEHSASLERIESRQCTTDNYNGVEYSFYGNFVPVRAIIDVVAETDGKGIEEMYFADDHGEACFGVFVANIPVQPHPAFVND